MSEVTLTINGRQFNISCDDGQEARVRELGEYLNKRLREIAQSGAASSENHLLLLTSLMLADEVFDLRDQFKQLDVQIDDVAALKREELEIAEAIDHLAGKIENIAGRMDGA